MMKHILIDARELTTSSGKYIYKLLENLDKLDKSNEYSVLIKPADMDSIHFSNKNFYKVRCPYKEFTFAEQIKLTEQINAIKPDLVHFPFPQQPILYKGKTITTIHDLTTLRFNNPSKNLFVFKSKQQVYARVIKRAVKKSSFVITPTNYVKEDLINFTGTSDDKVIVTYEAADPIKDKMEKVDKLVGKQFIMYIGRPTPHKNLERLIEAFVLLQNNHPNLNLVLAGKKDANYLKIEKSVKAKKIKNVVFTDFISDGQLKWLYKNTRAYIFPSLSEGFGLPGLEAMAHGAPVVSSSATCLPEVYKIAAKYFDPLSIESMVSSIDKVLTDKKLSDALVKDGYKLVEQYSWETMAKQTLAVYEKVLSS